MASHSIAHVDQAFMVVHPSPAPRSLQNINRCSPRDLYAHSTDPSHVLDALPPAKPRHAAIYTLNTATQFTQDITTPLVCPSNVMRAIMLPFLAFSRAWGVHAWPPLADSIPRPLKCLLAVSVKLIIMSAG